MKLSEHEHHRVLQINYSTGKGFEFQFYCQECFHPADHLKTADIEHILNEHAQLEAENDRYIAEIAGMRDKWTPPDELAQLEANQARLLAVARAVASLYAKEEEFKTNPNIKLEDIDKADAAVKAALAAVEDLL